MDVVKAYHKRRKNRLLKRFDADDVEWITTENGVHIPLKDGEAVGGPLEGEDFSDAKSSKGDVKRPPKRKQKDVPDGMLDDYGQVRKVWLGEFEDNARVSLKEETGYTVEQTDELYRSFSLYCDGFSLEEDVVKTIDDGLARMGAYDGEIYRGMYFGKEKADRVNDFLNLQVGDEIKMKSVSSWTSEGWCSKEFAKEMARDYSSVIFTCKNNKSGVGIQHISKFAKSEAEVLSPSTARWKIVGKEVISKYDYLKEAWKHNAWLTSELERDEKTVKNRYIVRIEVEEI